MKMSWEQLTFEFKILIMITMVAIYLINEILLSHAIFVK